MSYLLEHIHYIKDLIGAEYVGIGADFDGVDSVPRGLEDVSKYPVLFAELLRSGRWSIPELKGLAGLNFLRVMRRVEKVRDDLRTAGQTPYEQKDTIPKDNCSFDILKYEHDQYNMPT
ncbi:dipeptidase 2-like [Ctenocephalides felis]|uniref:dipeptidase 2-like n=1 Tax=Ctenocephalides felis TaxID=7515 RepID=UPI000E6E1196|nr:dipeptidase 2-like [Ctenocephalides felis]